MDLNPPLGTLMQPRVVGRWLCYGLLLAMLLLADSYVLVMASRRTGVFGLLAIVAASGLLPFVVLVTGYRGELIAIRSEIADGRYPKTGFTRLIALFYAGMLLLLPGIISDGLGLLLLVRPLGWLAGVLTERRLRPRFVELYEHLRADL